MWGSHRVLGRLPWLAEYPSTHPTSAQVWSPAVFSGCLGDDEGSCLTAETWLPGMNLPPVLLLKAQSPEDICCYSS